MLRRHYGNERFDETFWSSDDRTEVRTKNSPAGQILLEYIIVIGIVVLVLFAMSTMIKRGTQGMIKVVADQIGNQVNAEQDFENSGYLSSSYSSTRAETLKTKTDFLGNITYSFGDLVATNSEVVINLGFTENN